MTELEVLQQISAQLTQIDFSIQIHSYALCCVAAFTIGIFIVLCLKFTHFFN